MRRHDTTSITVVLLAGCSLIVGWLLPAPLVFAAESVAAPDAAPCIVINITIQLEDEPATALMSLPAGDGGFTVLAAPTSSAWVGKPHVKLLQYTSRWFQLVRGVAVLSAGLI